MTTMYAADASVVVQDSPKESGLSNLLDLPFLKSLKNTAAILARDTADLVTRGLLPELSTSNEDEKAAAVEERTRQAIEILARDPHLRKQEDKDAIVKLFRAAAKDGRQGSLMNAINEEAKERGLDCYLKITAQRIVNPRTDEHDYFETLSLVPFKPKYDESNTYLGVFYSRDESKPHK